MHVLRLLKGLFGGRPQRIKASSSGSAKPTAEQLREFNRLLDIDSLLQPGEGPLYVVLATGAFLDCHLRIVARQRETETSVEVAAFDVTTLPAVPRKTELEYLDRLVRESRVLHEAATASPDALARFHVEMGAVDWFEIGDDSEAGFDGYRFRGAVSDGKGRAHRFSAWSPNVRPGEGELPHFCFLRAMHQLASESIRDWRSLAALDALQSYAGLGEVFRDFGGSPRHVRIAGYVDPAQSALLVERLRALPEDEPVVLDLRELTGRRVAVAAVLTWGRECPNAHVVIPRRWSPPFRERHELGVEIPAERRFQDVATALGDGR
jgi:hypothetical protein